MSPLVGSSKLNPATAVLTSSCGALLAGSMRLKRSADFSSHPFSGSQLKGWLEKSAERFNRIDPASSAPQELVNTAVAGFNFDEPTSGDISYQIDVTQSVGQRIVDLRYQGREIA